VGAFGFPPRKGGKADGLGCGGDLVGACGRRRRPKAVTRTRRGSEASSQQARARGWKGCSGTKRANQTLRSSRSTLFLQKGPKLLVGANGDAPPGLEDPR